MAAILKFLSLSLVILCFFNGARGQCTILDINVDQSATGVSFQGKPEYEVMITNTCSICSQSSLLVSCDGYQSTESIPSSVITIQGSICSINHGQPLFDYSPIKFTYAWDKKFDFKPVNSEINCA